MVKREAELYVTSAVLTKFDRGAVERKVAFLYFFPWKLLDNITVSCIPYTYYTSIYIIIIIPGNNQLSQEYVSRRASTEDSSLSALVSSADGFYGMILMKLENIQKKIDGKVTRSQLQVL